MENMRDIPHKHFYMIRHGETVANAARIMAGSIDTPLTPRGITQAQSVRDNITALKTKPSIVIHSHLSRARDTARIINDALGAPVIEDPRYAEVSAGDLEGLSYDLRGDYRAGWTDMPNGETLQAFLTRVYDAKKDALNTYDCPLVVCHGGVFRAFYRLYHIDVMLVDNCVLHEFVPKGNLKNSDNNFPWDIFSYQNEGNEYNSMNRRPVVL